MLLTPFDHAREGEVIFTGIVGSPQTFPHALRGCATKLGIGRITSLFARYSYGRYTVKQIYELQCYIVLAGGQLPENVESLHVSQMSGMIKHTVSTRGKKSE